MWNAYAEDAKGCAIKFGEDFFDIKKETDMYTGVSSYSDKSYILYEVMYLNPKNLENSLEEEKKENSVEKKKTVRITSSLRKKYDLSSSSKLVKTKDGYEIVDLGAENLQVKYNVKIDKDNQIINVIKKEEVPNYSVIYDFDDNPVLVVDGKKIPILEYYSPTFVVDLFNLVCVKWVGYEPFDKKLNKTLDLVINDVIENDLNKKDSFKGPGMGHSKAKKAYTYLQSMKCYKSLVEDLDDEIIDAVRRVNGKNRQIKEVVKVVAEYLSFQNSTFTTDDYENLLAFTKKHDDCLHHNPLGEDCEKTFIKIIRIMEHHI